jgi:hypothetical protein
VERERGKRAEGRASCSWCELELERQEERCAPNYFSPLSRLGWTKTCTSSRCSRSCRGLLRRSSTSQVSICTRLVPTLPDAHLLPSLRLQPSTISRLQSSSSRFTATAKGISLSLRRSSTTSELDSRRASSRTSSELTTSPLLPPTTSSARFLTHAHISLLHFTSAESSYPCIPSTRRNARLLSSPTSRQMTPSRTSREPSSRVSQCQTQNGNLRTNM